MSPKILIKYVAQRKKKPMSTTTQNNFVLEEFSNFSETEDMFRKFLMVLSKITRNLSTSFPD